MSQARVRSPRCPSMSLEDALKRIGALYEQENKHQVAPDAAAQGLGYKDAKSGTAKKAIASLLYYGLLKRAADGKLSVSADYEKYKFAPEEDTRAQFLSTWLKNPKVFSSLIEKYNDNLPSDAALKYELIEGGFKPDTADEAANIFRESLNFVKTHGNFVTEPNDHGSDEGQDDSASGSGPLQVNKEEPNGLKNVAPIYPPEPSQAGLKPVPIFLPQGREGVLYLPRPFYSKDREIIKRQLDAILTDDEEGFENTV